MPSRNTIKEALPEAIFHVYNRGVERRRIFMDSHDYRRFKAQINVALQHEPSVDLWAYSLMPNHFHLLIHQSDALGMSRFMQRLGVAYVMYFNHRRHRVGPLFQGKYKAVRIVGPLQLMEVSRYIHLNPDRAGLGWRQHQHSSTASYLGQRSDNLVNPWPVLDLFDHPDDYAQFLSSAKVRPRAS
jgi:putative transposase